MAGGPVDDVIVACWVRLEDAAAGAGVERLPSETPAELAARVLADFDAPPDAVDAPARALPHGPLLRATASASDDRAAAIAALGDIRGPRSSGRRRDRPPRRSSSPPRRRPAAALLAMLVVVAAGWSPDVEYVLALAGVGAVARRGAAPGRCSAIAAPMWTARAPATGRSPRHRSARSHRWR